MKICLPNIIKNYGDDIPKLWVAEYIKNNMQADIFLDDSCLDGNYIKWGERK